MNHNETTKHIRNRITVSGIKASVTQSVICGDKLITVKPVSLDIYFTEEECKTIKIIAKTNKLTHVQGMEINTDLYIAGRMVFLFTEWE